MAIRTVSRRRLLSGSLIALGAAGLAACGTTPTPQVIEKVVTQIVEGTPQTVVETVVVKETVIVEGEAPSGAATEGASINISFYADDAMQFIDKGPLVTGKDNIRTVWEQMLAQMGAIVFQCDPRPASGKGACSAWTAWRTDPMVGRARIPWGLTRSMTLLGFPRP